MLISSTWLWTDYQKGEGSVTPTRRERSGAFCWADVTCSIVESHRCNLGLMPYSNCFSHKDAQQLGRGEYEVLDMVICGECSNCLRIDFCVCKVSFCCGTKIDLIQHFGFCYNHWIRVRRSVTACCLEMNSSQHMNNQNFLYAVMRRIGCLIKSFASNLQCPQFVAAQCKQADECCSNAIYNGVNSMLYWQSICNTQWSHFTMGNSLASRIKAAVISHDVESLQHILHSTAVRACDGVNMPLNRKQDGALSLAIRLARYELISVLLEAGAQVCNLICLPVLAF
jgi:hypothetical protein